MNLYKKLQNEWLAAQRTYQEYSVTCATVSLDGTVNDSDIRKIHSYILNNFNELVNDNSDSDGGLRTMKLIAPHADIITCLELVLEEFKDTLFVETEHQILTIISNLNLRRD